MASVIINADDFGLNKRCSEAIAEAFEKGLVTDTTMMATGEYFKGALSLARERGFSDKIGIHLNLTEGVPLTEEIRSCPRFVSDGRFNKNYNRLALLSQKEKAAIYRELTAQVERIEGAGIRITHADSHHHIHTAAFIAPIAMRVCKEYGITRIRLHRDLGEISFFRRIVKKRFNRRLLKKGFVTVDHFSYVMDLAEGVIPDSTEIMIHPDYDRDGVLIDRRGVEDGFPTGYPLPDFVKERNVTLRGYAELG